MEGCTLNIESTATVKDHAKVIGYAYVHGNAKVLGYVNVYGHAMVDCAILEGDVTISDGWIRNVHWWKDVP